MAEGSTSPEAADPKQISQHIAEVSKNARATWFGLLGYLAFSLLVLMGFRDIDIFKGGRGIELPFVGTKVEPLLYISIAPILFLMIHIYLHVHLMKVWEALPRLAKLFDNAELRAHELRERVYPWLIADFALRRGKNPLIGHNPLSRTADMATVFLAWTAVPLMLCWFWVISMPLHSLPLSGFLAMVFLASIYVSSLSFGEIIRLIYPGRENWAWPVGRLLSIFNHRLSGVATVIFILWLSVETTLGGLVPRLFGERYSLVVRTDLSLEELSERPEDWMPFDLWMLTYEEEFRRREGIERGVPLSADLQELLSTEATSRRSAELSALSSPRYPGWNFEGAIFDRSFVAGADFRRADLNGASFMDAVMEGVDLRGASLKGTNFQGAQLQLARLREARLEGALLRGAQLQMADVGYARLEGVSLDFARLDRAYLALARLEGASLARSRLDGADARRASFVGADLREASLVGANLAGARFFGASLAGAKLLEANCEFTDFDAAVLDATDLTCSGLLQAQLRLAVGDERTVLPDGLYVFSCLVRDDLSDEDLGRFGPSVFPQRRSFCEDGEVPRRIGR